MCDGSFHVAVYVSLLLSGASSNDEVEASHRLERIKPLQPRDGFHVEADRSETLGTASRPCRASCSFLHGGMKESVRR